MTGITRCFV